MAEITSLDLLFLVDELKNNLIGGAFRKIYQYGSSKSKQFLFEIFTPGKGNHWLYVDNNKMFLTEFKKAVPQEPPNFCMFLRKHILNHKIRNIKQHDFDRIIEIYTDNHILIFELFSKGNAILCDMSRNVIMPLEIQRWKDRQIKPKALYVYPPKIVNPFEISDSSILRSARTSDKKTVAFVASALGFGSLYANEICTRAMLDKERPANKLSGEEVVNLHTVILSLLRTPRNACIYDDVVTPFRLESYKDKKCEEKESFSSALDQFFSNQVIEVAKEEVKKVAEKKVEKIEHIIESQEKSKEKWDRIEKDSRECAEAIYSFYSTVKDVLDGIRKAKDSGMKWSEIKERVKNESTSEAESIKEIRENDGIVVVDLGGKEVELDIRLSVEENAAKYYDDAKWAKKKIKGAGEAQKVQEEKLEEAEEIEEEEKPVLKKKRRKKWFEKFKWFTSSDGFLVIAGRNATQNEMILVKHTNPDDYIFHSDIQGAAFVAIISDGKPVGRDAMKEAAEFAAANSKAWGKGLGKISVFSVQRSQAVKEPGMEKGSYAIRGDRIWFKDQELKLAIGVKVDKKKEEAIVVYGPVMAIRKNGDYFVTIKPGFTRAPQLAQQIKRNILIKARPDDKFLIETIPIEDFEAAIPAGMGDVVDIGNF